MALIWIDGFDHYNTSGSTVTPAVISGAYLEPIGAGYTFSSTAVRGLALSTDTNSLSAGRGPRRQVTPTLELGIGFHFRAATISRSGHHIMTIQDSSATRNLTVALESGTGRLQLFLGDTSGTVLATSVNTIAANVWYHLEVRFKKSTTVGLFEVRVNGATWVTFSGNTGASTCEYVEISGTRSGTNQSANYFFDNLYIWDTTGTVNNDWLGERNVYTLMPASDTADADWTKSTGSVGYDLINDIPANAATNYIQGNVVTDESRFGLADLPTTDIVIKGVQTVVRGVKTGTSDNQIEFGVFDGTTKSASPSTPMSQTTSLYFAHISELNPTTGLEWTPAEIDALQVYVTRTV